MSFLMPAIRSPFLTWMIILAIIFLLALFKVTITNEEAKELPPQ